MCVSTLISDSKFTFLLLTLQLKKRFVIYKKKILCLKRRCGQKCTYAFLSLVSLSSFLRVLDSLPLRFLSLAAFTFHDRLVLSVLRLSAMPPPRDLPDLCLLEVFKQLPLHDRMKANNVCWRWRNILRETNRQVRTLTIFIDNEPSDENYSGVRQMKISTDGDDEPVYPKYPITKMNILPIASNSLNTASVHQIVTTFYAVTELTFENKADLGVYKYAVKLLQSQWSFQLVTFKLKEHWRWSNGSYQSSNLNEQLFNAINALSALKHLTIELYNAQLQMYELDILAQLKKVVVVWMHNSSGNLKTFLSSLKSHATRNKDLQISMMADVSPLSKRTLNISKTLCSRIVQFITFYEYNLTHLSSTCNDFPSLITLPRICVKPSKLCQSFTHLLKLQQLVHLNLKIDFSQSKPQEYSQAFIRPLAVLNSVKSLDLNLTITLHSQLQWLNLKVVLPNLSTIHFYYFECKSCQINMLHCDTLDSNSPTKLQHLDCIQSSLPLLHSGVSHRRISFE